MDQRELNDKNGWVYDPGQALANLRRAETAETVREHAADLLREACYLLRSAWAFVPPGHQLGEKIRTFLNGEPVTLNQDVSPASASDAILKALRQFDYSDRAKDMTEKLIYFGNARTILEDYIAAAKKSI